jgi:hypothetical protein
MNFLKIHGPVGVVGVVAGEKIGNGRLLSVARPTYKISDKCTCV